MPANDEELQELEMGIVSIMEDVDELYKKLSALENEIQALQDDS